MGREVKTETKRKRKRGRETARNRTAKLIEATRKSLQSSETVMKRTDSLRFAVLASGWVSREEGYDRLCLLISHRTLTRDL